MTRINKADAQTEPPRHQPVDVGPQPTPLKYDQWTTGGGPPSDYATPQPVNYKETLLKDIRDNSSHIVESLDGFEDFQKESLQTIKDASTDTLHIRNNTSNIEDQLIQIRNGIYAVLLILCGIFCKLFYLFT